MSDLRRLAALLAVRVEELPDGLAALTDAQLAEVVDHVSGGLHRRDRARLSTLAGMVDRLPTGVVVKVVQERLDPRLVARLAAQLPPGAGESVIVRLEPRYLADVVSWIEPARCARLLAAIPAALVVEVALLLAADERYVVMAAVSEHLPDATLARALDALDDHAVAETVACGRVESGPRVLSLVDPARAGRLRVVLAA